MWTCGLPHLRGLPHLPGGPLPPCKQALSLIAHGLYFLATTFFQSGTYVF